MAHFSEIDSNNYVIRVLVIPNEEENRGEEFLSIDLGLGGRWLKTSYNTIGNKHMGGGIPFRKNFGSIGYQYIEDLDGFIPPQPYPSWLLNEDSGLWYPPIPKPDSKTDEISIWDESIIDWKIIPYGLNTTLT
jgi:hypothetical protein